MTMVQVLIPSPAPILSPSSAADRILRGGSRPSGSGSRPSWGSPSVNYRPSFPSYRYPSYNNHNNNNSGGSGAASAAAIVIAIVLGFGFLVVLFFVCRHVSASNDEESFDKKVAAEQESVKESAKSNIEEKDPDVVPKGGSYLFSYKDDGYEDKTGKAMLKFEDNNYDGYHIYGLITDDDGTSKIQEGFAGYGGRAYWVDECTASVIGNVGLKVLSAGYFNFASGSFMGSWVASSSISGSYLSFQCVDAENTNSPSIVEATVPAYAVNPEPTAPLLQPDPTANVEPIVPVVPIVPTPGKRNDDEEEEIVVAPISGPVVPNPGGY